VQAEEQRLSKKHKFVVKLIFYSTLVGFFPTKKQIEESTLCPRHRPGNKKAADMFNQSINHMAKPAKKRPKCIDIKMLPTFIKSFENSILSNVASKSKKLLYLLQLTSGVAKGTIRCCLVMDSPLR